MVNDVYKTGALIIVLLGISWIGWTLKLQNAEITALRSQISSQTALIKKQKVQELSAELPLLLDKLTIAINNYKKLRADK